MRTTESDFAEFQAKTSTAFREMLKAKNIAVDELTRDQLAEALRQAVDCGDFIRLVRVDDRGQTVIYLPGDGVDRLRQQLDEAKDLLKRLRYNPSSVMPLEIEYFLRKPSI